MVLDGLDKPLPQQCALDRTRDLDTVISFPALSSSESDFGRL
jgi:hypothetical protein